jgi:hypothetical protein
MTGFVACHFLEPRNRFRLRCEHAALKPSDLLVAEVATAVAVKREYVFDYHNSLSGLVGGSLVSTARKQRRP